MLDPEQKKKALQELGGLPEEVYDEIVREFIAQTRPQLTQLKIALTAGDLKSVGRLSHSIKGSSGNLRVKPIHEIALRMEEAAKAGRPAGLAEDVARVHELLEKLACQFGV